MSGNKKEWKVFWDLQCPYSKKNWELFPSIKMRFQSEYEFSVHITSLLFHPQAFTAQCGAALINAKKGVDAKQQYIEACFYNQDSFMNAAVGDGKKSEIDAIFADIAEKAGIFTDDKLTKEDFLANLHNWELAVYPAWTEHKEALALGVMSTPKQVIDGKLIAESESSWGPDEWADKLSK